MTSHNVLVLATGEGSGGGAASTLLQRCRDHEVGTRWWVTLMTDTQLRIEHALNLTRADLGLFLIDEAPRATTTGAMATHGDGFSLRAIAPGSGHQLTSSESDLSPEDLLHTLATLGRHGREPRCYVLALRRAATGDGSLDEALALLTDLLEHPEAEHWDRRLAALA